MGDRGFLALAAVSAVSLVAVVTVFGGGGAGDAFQAAAGSGDFGRSTPLLAEVRNDFCQGLVVAVQNLESRPVSVDPSQWVAEIRLSDGSTVTARPSEVYVKTDEGYVTLEEAGGRVQPNGIFYLCIDSLSAGMARPDSELQSMFISGPDGVKGELIVDDSGIQLAEIVVEGGQEQSHGGAQNPHGGGGGGGPGVEGNASGGGVGGGEGGGGGGGEGGDGGGGEGGGDGGAGGGGGVCLYSQDCPVAVTGSIAGTPVEFTLAGTVRFEVRASGGKVTVKDDGVTSHEQFDEGETVVVTVESSEVVQVTFHLHYSNGSFHLSIESHGGSFLATVSHGGFSATYAIDPGDQLVITAPVVITKLEMSVTVYAQLDPATWDVAAYDCEEHTLSGSGQLNFAIVNFRGRIKIVPHGGCGGCGCGGCGGCGCGRGGRGGRVDGIALTFSGCADAIQVNDVYLPPGG